MTIENKKITKKDLKKVFWRSNFHQGSWNFERMQNLGYCYAMLPVLNKLYKGEEKKEALKRHLEFFNTHPFVTAPILGLSAAMEEEKASGADIEDAAISGIKVGLMGPLAGVGDPIFWGTLRPVLAALGATFALTGNLIGPLIFFLGFNIVRLAVRWYGIDYGYKKGMDIIQDVAGNTLQKVTEGASILGLFVMGALVNQWTNINIGGVVSDITLQDGTRVVTTVQDILDQLMPGLAALLLTFLCVKLLKKKISPLMLILGLFGVGIVGYALGILV